MPRVQTFRLPVAVFAAVAALFMVGCSKEKSHTVAEYLHDIDAAKAAEKKYSNEPAKYASNPDSINASAATGKISFLNDCFPPLKDGQRFTTANTDHACLDKEGYTR